MKYRYMIEFDVEDGVPDAVIEELKGYFDVQIETLADGDICERRWSYTVSGSEMVPLPAVTEAPTPWLALLNDDSGMPYIMAGNRAIVAWLNPSVPVRTCARLVDSVNNNGQLREALNDVLQKAVEALATDPSEHEPALCDIRDRVKETE